MPVFISHDFDDKAQFDNITNALEQEDIQYFNPYEMLAGRSLSEMLREAIRQSEVCVFIATHNSVDSGWCGAELGAFWGVGKKVILFIADSSIDPQKLPKQFNGHIREDRIKNVVKAVKEYLGAKDPDGMTDTPDSNRVSDMTRSELLVLVESAIQRSQTEAESSSIVGELAEFTTKRDLKSLSDAEHQQLRVTLNSLLGLSEIAFRKATVDNWPYQFSLSTTTGKWNGYAIDDKYAGPGGDITVYLKCLLLRFDEQQRVTASAMLPHVVDKQWVGGGWDLTDPVEIVGRGQIGDVV